MAERKSNAGRSNTGRSNAGRSNAKKISAGDAARTVREEFPDLLGRPLESVLAVQRDGDDGWQVMVQVIELERIPRSTDVLGAYEVELDKIGELVGYRRVRRFHRGQPDED